MSCSLCRLPFTPSKTSICPRPIPEGALDDDQREYMTHAVAIGKYVIGLVIDMIWNDGNLFSAPNSPIIITITWEVDHKTFIALHRHCATLLRHRLGFSSDDHDTLINFALLEHIVGPTMDGVHAGRLRDVSYERVRDRGKRVDIESLWSPDPAGKLGQAIFDWAEWKRLGLDWTATRPDVFPYFRSQPTKRRIPPLPPSTADILSTQPLDVLHALLPYLDDKSFINLLSTCRFLRHHALTTFQPHARQRVLALGWAVPTEVEYQAFVRRKLQTSATGEASPSGELLASLAMAHAEHSPVDADWHLYLAKVYCSQAMRARRWVWALAGEVARVYHAKRAVGPYADRIEESEEGPPRVVRSKAWQAYATAVGQHLMMRSVIRGGHGRTQGPAKAAPGTKA